MLTDKVILITGGTGSLGKVLVRRLLRGDLGLPKRIIVFSRDEAKQYAMQTRYKNEPSVELRRLFEALVRFKIGDVRDFQSVLSALQGVDVVFNAAALKQVPTCEYAPFEAVQTNINGAQNIVQAIRAFQLPVETVVGISTDKACKPVNVMGMTKALQERMFISANLESSTRFICVRYGNVLASRGSVIPLFHEQIRAGNALTVTSAEMTRFLLSLDRAVDTIFEALQSAQPGDIYVPRVPSARILDVAKLLIGDRPLMINMVGIRPGEKIHEVMVSEEEAWRTTTLEHYYVIHSSLPSLYNGAPLNAVLLKEYSSADVVMDVTTLTQFLDSHHLFVDQRSPSEELLV
ncbi:MAG: NAD-dependent epimerase/dehydratase family protein [Chloroflexi bacterium CFX4]|nr:NAD-dependent epimerase/dehydratase family protein [Chloroflexi bacterium CFX4]MDL1923185.1 NAD-dependent epimerase/dehydratase family protein [Chloroflexi bacterium CFX3]